MNTGQKSNPKDFLGEAKKFFVGTDFHWPWANGLALKYITG